MGDNCRQGMIWGSSSCINGASIPFSPLVRSLGVTRDPTLTFREYISNICETDYLEPRRISSIPHYLSVDATKTLVCSFLLLRFDDCSSLSVEEIKTELQTKDLVQKCRVGFLSNLQNGFFPFNMLICSS